MSPYISEDRIANKAIERWVSYGLECVIAPGFASINGYVRLPEGHPDWKFKSMNEEREEINRGIEEAPEGDSLKNLPKWPADKEDTNVYYWEIDVDVHGDLYLWA